jgi:fatty-acyl-CoA synthase
VIHSWAVGLPDALELSANDAVLPVVPMFHANCWGLVHAAPMTGAKLIFPGPGMDGQSVHEMVETGNATILAGVPTVWLMLLDYLKKTGKRLDGAKSSVIGGSAAPRSMIETFQNDYGVQVLHAWGMTEMSPVGTVGRLLPKHAGLSDKEKIDIQVKQGRGIFGVEMKIVDDEGRELPRDGEAFGNLMVRGPWIASSYFKGEGGEAFDDESWFDTGDVATLDPDGYMQITDRSKDVIKSGGEWISSIELENIAVGHPDVTEACVIGVHHPKWDERPLLLIIRTEGSKLNRDEILAFYEGKVAKWWVPDDVVFVTELPHTATGKLLKIKLRTEYGDYKLPTT